MSENPVIHLFDISYKGWTRRFQQKYSQSARWAGLLILLYLGLGFLGTVGVAFAQFGSRAGWAILWGEVAGFGMLLIPASVGGAVFMAMQSVRQGRSLEEILSAGVPAPRVIDGFVMASLRHVARLTLMTWLALLAGSLGLLEYGPAAPLVALAWLPAVAVLSTIAAYHWGRHAVANGFDYWQQTFVTGGIMLLGCFLLAVIPPEWTGVCSGLGLVFVMAFAVWISRRETIDRLNRPAGRVRRHAPRQAAGPIPEGNALMVRETMRRLSWSWWARHWDALATVALGLFYCLAIAADPSPHIVPALPLLVFWWVLVMFAPFRAAFRSLEVFQTDRQAGTLESLLTTRLTATDAVEGAARLGWERPLREIALVGVAFLPLGFLLDFAQAGNLSFVQTFASGVAICGVGAAWYLIAMFAASYLGVAAGLRSGSRQEAWMKLGGWCIKAYFAFWGACLAVLPLAGMAEWTGNPFVFKLPFAVYSVALFVLAPYILWRWSRGIAYRSLRNSPTEPGFC